LYEQISHPLVVGKHFVERVTAREDRIYFDLSLGKPDNTKWFFENGK